MFTAPWKANCTLQSACKILSFPVLPGPLLSRPATLSFVTHYSHAPPATGWQLVSHMLVRITASTWHNSIPESHGTVMYKHQILPKYRDSVQGAKPLRHRLILTQVLLFCSCRRLVWSVLLAGEFLCAHSVELSTNQRLSLLERIEIFQNCLLPDICQPKLWHVISCCHLTVFLGLSSVLAYVFVGV